jgi:hypothetical protein
MLTSVDQRRCGRYASHQLGVTKRLGLARGQQYLRFVSVFLHTETRLFVQVIVLIVLWTLLGVKNWPTMLQYEATPNLGTNPCTRPAEVLSTADYSAPG